MTTQKHWHAMSNEAILQIIPASGVSAVFDDGEKYPVVCWALVELYVDDEDPPARYQNVIGMVLVDGVSYLETVEDAGVAGKFTRYVYDN